MALSPAALHQVLESGVVEIKFVRRNPKPGGVTTRRMLASLSIPILDSEAGRTVFRFTPPSGPSAYNATEKNLVMGFDIFIQNWRAIPADSTEIVRILPTEPEEFWAYFYENLAKMTADQKAAFMNS